MSFITKRERVFNEYDLFDLPARNEGKLKTYASCTDARAWSHFCSDNTEHLVDIIKRNNVTCRPKYVPTDVIVNTLMVAKNTEIGRLKRRIEEFEQMLAAYDQLDLTSDQKCEIATAHAAIKAANKELDEMCLDLNLSCITEGIDSECFETGKSRGDETNKSVGDEMLSYMTGKSRGDECDLDKGYENKETKGNQFGTNCTSDATTNACDPRIDEMKDTIICKDAKLVALKNTIAIMENDICEPYCIYANIYTALEKIFGILCQNKKYKQYLDLLAAGKDTRNIDLKGKIIFKIKVLEKFCIALVAPCNQGSSPDCSCCRTEIVAHMETSFALTSAESKQPTIDKKRALLVADIMDNEEIKEIFSKESLSNQDFGEENFGTDNYNINEENLKRLKTLQSNYDDLLTCYDNLKYERDCLIIRNQTVKDLESECECLQGKLKEYNQLWNENIYFKKRSEDLDKLQATYYVLFEETSNLETKLKAEMEINKIKTENISELRDENILLDKRLNEITIEFEKEKNVLCCKIKEYECKILCEEQQIKSLSYQIDKLLEQGSNKIPTNEEVSQTIELINEIESQKEQIKNLTHACLCNADEKNSIQLEFEKNLQFINELKMELVSWKSKYEEQNENSELYKKYIQECQKKIEELHNENQKLTKNTEKQKNAVDNLYEMLHKKSQEINDLNEAIDQKNLENTKLLGQTHNMQKRFNASVASFEYEKKLAINSLQLVRQKSHEMLKPEDDFDNFAVNKHEETELIEISNDRPEITSKNSEILKEIEILQEDNISTINFLKENNKHYKKSLELTKKESIVLKGKLDSFEQLTKDLTESHDNLTKDKKSLENFLHGHLNDLKENFQITKKKSQILFERLQNSEFEKEEYILRNETLQNDINSRDNEILSLNIKLENILEKNKDLHKKIENLEARERSLNDDILRLQNENLSLQSNLDASRKDHSTAMEYYQKLEHDLDSLNYAYDENKNKNKELQKMLESEKRRFYEVEKENHDVIKQCEKFTSLNENLQRQLEQTHKEFISETASIHDFYNNIKEEIENLKKQKNKDFRAIENLKEKLNIANDTITELTEDVVTRDKNISLLQNHINELQDEVHKLHDSLNAVIVTGEEIKDHNIETIENSVKTIQAHYSKATHNIKMDMAKLEDKNAILESQLSSTQFINEESLLKKHKYLSQIEFLQNEQKRIITEVYHLEIKTVGTSALSTSSTVDSIIISLNNISKSFDERKTSLEKTLLNVQNSYQLLKSKADEAKYIAETEIKKILDEKEDARLERDNIKKQLEKLRTQLKEQNLTYEQLIKDLEAQMLNQKLMADRIRLSDKDHIEKLKKEMHILQEIYENSKTKIDKYERETQDLMQHNSKYKKTIEKLQNDLANKLQEIAELNKSLDIKINKIVIDVGFQTTISENKTDQFVQTESNVVHDTLDRTEIEETNKKIGPDWYNSTGRKRGHTKISSDFTSHEMQNSINEVRILTANVEPSLDFVRNIYLDYKIKRLEPGGYQQYSLSSLTAVNNDNNNMTSNHLLSEYTEVETDKHVVNSLSDIGLVDIYKTENYTGASKFSSVSTNNFNRKDNHVEVASVKINLSKHNNRKSHKKNKYNQFESESTNSIEEDLFVIFTDSDNVSEGKKSVIDILDTTSNSLNNQKEISLDFDEDASKPKLKIKLPRTINDSPSALINKKSLDSYTLAIHSTHRTKTQSEINLKNNDLLLTTISYLTISPVDDNSYTMTNHKNNDVFIKKLPHANIETEVLFNKSRTETRDPDDVKIMKESNRKSYHAHVVAESKNHYNQTYSKHNLGRISGNEALLNNKVKHIGQNNVSSDPNLSNSTDHSLKHKPINETSETSFNVKTNLDADNILRKKESDKTFYSNSDSNLLKSYMNEVHPSPPENKTAGAYYCKTNSIDSSVLTRDGTRDEYENKIKMLTEALDNIEKYYKKKIDAVKIQYDSNIKNIINEHNQGVVSLQSLHEETLQDIIKVHDQEIENLRTMSIDAMRKAEKLEKENINLKLRLQDMKFQDVTGQKQEAPKTHVPDLKRRRCKLRDSKILIKTDVEAFNVNPKQKTHGPCTCSLDINISDTIRNIFDHVDVEQRKIAEQTYLKYIANKMYNFNIEKLDTQELSFLHLKVCRLWKTQLNKEEAIQLKINSLESELINKQRQAQRHIADLDRIVAEERYRLQQVRDAVCCPTSTHTPDNSQTHGAPPSAAEKDVCGCTRMIFKEGASAGDLAEHKSKTVIQRRVKMDNRAVSAQLNIEERRGKRPCDETPTKLRRPDRHNRVCKK